MATAKHRQSYHVHTEIYPYCMSWSFSDPKGAAHKTALDNAEAYAKDMKCVVLGPFDFDFSRCVHRVASMEEQTKDAEESLEHIPIIEQTLHPGYEASRQQTPYSWHVHTDNASWCRSFKSLEEAQRWIDQGGDTLTRKPKRPRIVGPLRHPAAACHYYHVNTRRDIDEKHRKKAT